MRCGKRQFRNYNFEHPKELQLLIVEVSGIDADFCDSSISDRNIKIPNYHFRHTEGNYLDIIT